MQNKVIIFSEFSEMCKILKRELSQYNPSIIIGETSSKDRQEAVERFNKDQDCKVLIMSSAGAYGLNLQAANVVIHFDQAWSIAKTEQREGRALRIGQKQKVLIYNLLGIKTVDYHLKKIIKTKKSLSEDILTMDDLQQLLL